MTTTRMRFTTAQRAGIIAGAVASGRIPAAKAAAYQAEIAAGGTRAGTAIARLLAMYPAGRPLGPSPGGPGSPELAAARAEDETWLALFGQGTRQPAARDADQARKVTPMTAAEYAKLWPEPLTSLPPDPGPPMPELAGYVPSVKLTAPDEAPPPQLDMAARRQAEASAPGWERPAVYAGIDMPQIGTLGIVEHGETTAWHTHAHAHPGSDLNGHSHQHVHQAGSAGSHAIGPGHDHDAPVEYTPDLATAAGRVARAVAASAASPCRRVAWGSPARWTARPPGR